MWALIISHEKRKKAGGQCKIINLSLKLTDWFIRKTRKAAHFKMCTYILNNSQHWCGILIVGLADGGPSDAQPFAENPTHTSISRCYLGGIVPTTVPLENRPRTQHIHEENVGVREWRRQCPWGPHHPQRVSATKACRRST